MSLKLVILGLSMRMTATLPLDKLYPERLASLSIILTWTSCSINLAAKATELSSTPSVAHITAWLLTSIVCFDDSQVTILVLIFSGTVIASRP